MIDFSDLETWLILIGFTAAQTVFLVVMLLLFQPPFTPSSSHEPDETSPDGVPRSRGKTVRRAGFIRRFGLFPGGAICFGFLFALTAVQAFPGGILAAIIGWWVLALTLFGLTVRQTFKLNIAFALFGVALMVGLGLAAAHVAR
jgi:hypothetical protein